MWWNTLLRAMFILTTIPAALLAIQKSWPLSLLRFCLDVEAVSRSHKRAPTPPHRCCHAARLGSTPLCSSAGDKEKPINMMERVVNLLAQRLQPDISALLYPVCLRALKVWGAFIEQLNRKWNVEWNLQLQQADHVFSSSFVWNRSEVDCWRGLLSKAF